MRSSRRRLTRGAARAGVVVLVSSLLAACGSNLIYGSDGGGKTTLTWYANPDPPPPEGTSPADFGQPGIAQRCSTDEYDIEVETLPSSASEQRIQLARRLAAEDSSIDLMSLDPVFVAEFADAGFLERIPEDMQADLEEGVLQGAIDGATWEDELVVAPLWANTQLLWYRKSLADAAGLDMTEPVTWDQVIDAAVEQGGTVGVQANKYEGYVVWINALIAGAGGEIVTDTEAGSDAAIELGSEAGTEAARVVQKLADSPAAQADLSVSNEGTVLGPFAEDPGGFQVNWTFIFQNYAADEAVAEDLGWARYPQTVEGQESAPPIGGIDVGVGSATDHPDLALEAVSCITSEQNQVTFALETGQMPAGEAAYEDAELQDTYPPDLLELFQESIENAGPRPPSPYWGSIVNAILNVWHPAGSVNPNTTPGDSAEFVEAVLNGDALV
ncbi:MAG: extracellular solute-binding protein [Propionibacteriales bacterium]|nr:extracellular solute-binding protein [Propionibacteriales bacterium]